MVNGAAGEGDRRTVRVEAGGPLDFEMLLPPAGGPGRFVVHANVGAPRLDTVTALPASIGTTCFPLLLNSGADPQAIWNSLGRESRVGSSRYFDGSPITDPMPAPTIFLDLPAGDLTFLPAGTTLTLQGVILDPGSASTKSASATNAVEIVIE